MNKKKRILVVTESSMIASGFGTYAKELLQRLYDTNKYELAEFACFAHPLTFNNTKWTIYCNAPVPGGVESQYEQEHNNNPVLQWGLARFEYACLDFQPDIVITYRDPWMDAYIADSPFLPFFHWVWMPTIDSEPQKTEWLYMFNKCDGLLAYSEFGIETLKKQTNNRLVPFGCGTPGVDEKEFSMILNQEKHKANMGLPPDSFIVGTMMRNQKRKMFAELMRGFSQFLNSTSKEIKEKSYLLIHTSYPERIGWDITSLMHEFDLNNKLLCTYTCQHCKKYFVSIFRDALTTCKHCNANNAAVMPGVSNGIDHAELKNIYNCMDLYVQYAICEGLGMPAVEAAACGIPIAAIYYSAMKDVVDNVDGFPIAPLLDREMETNADRSHGNNKELVKVLLSYSKTSPEDKIKTRLKTRKKCFARYDWNKTISVWESYLDSVVLNKQPWNSPQMMRPVPTDYPKNLDHYGFAEWICNHVLQDPTYLFNYKMLFMIRSLNLGASFGPGSMSPCTQHILYEENKHIGNRRFFFDAVRSGIQKVNPPGFIIEAHNRKIKSS